ncbi:hypothetical protein AVEN_137720-1 [Araneus ventricosus]|uniref:Uncharacterized protein n=1 Tax=Araneus ventricosus TaxID=182803 RepID=A0A4Y2JAR3_ARAVE|nr:hypothetical protein AVEN_137720-1 [Araneus ventricosus]
MCSMICAKCKRHSCTNAPTETDVATPTGDDVRNSKQMLELGEIYFQFGSQAANRKRLQMHARFFSLNDEDKRKSRHIVEAHEEVGYLHIFVDIFVRRLIQRVFSRSETYNDKVTCSIIPGKLTNNPTENDRHSPSRVNSGYR